MQSHASRLVVLWMVDWHTFCRANMTYVIAAFRPKVYDPICNQRSLGFSCPRGANTRRR